MVRFEVEAVAKKPVPFAVRFVVLAPPFMEKSPLVIVEDADKKPPVKLMSVEVDSPYEAMVQSQGFVRVIVPPSATSPPPERPLPAVTVTELAERRVVQ